MRHLVESLPIQIIALCQFHWKLVEPLPIQLIALSKSMDMLDEPLPIQLIALFPASVKLDGERINQARKMCQGSLVQ